MKNETKLITVPTTTFNQGDNWDQVVDSERPIHIDYYNGTICLRQDGQYDEQEEILISPKYLDQLSRFIKKNLAEADKHHKNA